MQIPLSCLSLEKRLWSQFPSNQLMNDSEIGWALGMHACLKTQDPRPQDRPKDSIILYVLLPTLIFKTSSNYIGMTSLLPQYFVLYLSYHIKTFSDLVGLIDTEAHPFTVSVRQIFTTVNGISQHYYKIIL